MEVRENIDVEREVKTAHNVLGICPERPMNTSSSARITIISVLGEQFSLAPSLAGTVHPGADDNASGTAGVIELAKHFAAQVRN